MKTVYSPAHLGHSGYLELTAEGMVPGFEKPSRAEIIKARVEAVRLGPVVAPDAHDIAIAKQVHRADYIDLLPTIWPRWEAERGGKQGLPFTWPTRGLRGDRVPRAIEAVMGNYSFDAGAPFVPGTWDAIKASHDVAITGAALVEAGERAAFSLCRPPGHHAGSAFMGGYCYINNAASAAQWFRDKGAARVAILDVDYHHGNGTQEMFYDRADILVVNLHGDPMDEYPFFLGHADETGTGAGEGFNVNYPMPFGTAWDQWSEALEDGCRKVADFAPDVVVVSLGVDTCEKDPISKFKLTSDDYPKIGRRSARLGLPTHFVMEGGYAVEEIGINAVGVLTGFEEG